MMFVHVEVWAADSDGKANMRDVVCAGVGRQCRQLYFL